MDTNYQYFDCLCRTCMNELVEATSYDGNTKPQQQWQSIFDRFEECGAFRIAELLTNAVPQIEVQPRDELPKRICCKCLQELLIVYRFQQMCIQSEQQMRQGSKKRSDLEIPMIGATMEGEIETNNAGSYPLTSLQPSSTHQNLEHSSIQESLLETTEQMVKPEAAETSDDIDKLLEDCRDAEGNFSEFLKNEPNEDDEPDIEYSNDGTTNTAISEKNEQLPIEFEEQQINETNVKKHHSRHAEDDKPYKCPYCRRKFNTISNMYQHKARHEVACDICGKTIVKYHLKKHKLTHSNEKAHKCDFCGKRFNRITSLRIHIRTHTGEKPYKCKYCERSFADLSHRIRHMRIHLGDNIYRCELCPLVFPLAKKLRAHLTEHSNDDSETRERNMKALKEAEAKLQLKLSETETQQPYKEESKQQLEIKAKENVRTYRFMHGEDKPYGCPYCPRRFNNPSNMHRHKVIHEGVKRVSCDICGKSILKTSLKTHKLIHNKEKAHKCDICEMGFDRISNLRVHMRKHSGEKPYKCKYCERSFSHSSHRINHMRFHLGDNVHRCKLCPLAFPLAKELRGHLTEHNNEDSETRERNMKALKEAEAKLQVELSKNETQQPSKEQSQQQYEMPGQKDHSTHGEDKLYKCPYCTRKFNTISNMYQHKACHEVACDICGKTIVKYHLKKHKLTHSNEKAHKCDFCGKRFTEMSNLRRHMRKHTGENIHRCKLCPLAFPLAKELRAHLTVHENDDSETRERNMKALKEAEVKLQLELSKKHIQEAPKCDFCGKCFTGMSNLRRHMRKHTGEKAYKCKYCERSFNDPSHRIRHMRSHLGDNIYRCELCPLAFPLAKELRAHLTEHNNEDSETRERNMKALKEAEAKLQLELSKNETQQPSKEQSQQQYEMPVQKDHSIHAADKPYKCPHCRRKFNTISNMYQHKARHEVACDICGKTMVKHHLKRHKLTHSNEKALKCDFCGKCFARNADLRRHIRKHTGEKPYKCKYCERSFNDPSHRINHMRLHLGDNIYRCELCPLAFPLAKELRAHLTEHDNDDSETRERNMKALKEAEAKLQLKLSKEKYTAQPSKEENSLN